LKYILYIGYCNQGDLLQKTAEPKKTRGPQQLLHLQLLLIRHWVCCR